MFGDEKKRDSSFFILGRARGKEKESHVFLPEFVNELYREIFL